MAKISSSKKPVSNGPIKNINFVDAVSKKAK